MDVVKPVKVVNDISTGLAPACVISSEVLAVRELELPSVNTWQYALLSPTSSKQTIAAVVLNAVKVVSVVSPAFTSSVVPGVVSVSVPSNTTA
jgi:hypothetical protein